MKRLWIGVALLAVMLAGGISILLISHHFYDEFSATLESAAQAAESENWFAAGELVQNATTHWRRHHHLFASFTDHEPVEELELLLSRLELFQKAQLTVEFVDTCSGLTHLCQAIDESHNLRWWSIL